MLPKSHRFMLLAIAVAGSAFFTQVVMADGDAHYPAFATLKKDKADPKMLDRDAITPALEKKYPRLAGLKSHWDDADLDHDGKINQAEYDAYVSVDHGT
ncbi:MULTISPECIES: hypothetical protein [unclassified Luteibacter]|uniref:hypothetical protein n=1 Tax=unclassified Luteibacter TaxID=2620188 RepID=UPI0008D2FA6F|nr:MULTISPECIES: hypothetical protein [unclassified Luteibacter]MDR6935626.1 hypothetical protein [Luteibacter sp. 3190]SEO94975.1 hypothetical protein SAMN02800692_2962 [Luteibacter sp. UNC138MFCol5.1]SEV93334.1 hypothetical protein SAMN04515660_1090 [Luteibacter sp. 329MFSha]